MNIKIVYNSKTGNTKKVAETMADTIGQKAESINSVKEINDIDLLFIGAAVYATHDHDIDPNVENFILSLDSEKVKQAVVFCTGFSDMANTRMRNLLENRGIKVKNESFMCKGKLFKIFNYGHPNIEDLENAKNFAKNIIDNLK